MVLPRVLTALIAAPLFLWAVYLGSIPYFLFVFFLILLGLWEFHQMADTGGYSTQSWLGIAGGMLVFLAMAFPGIKPEVPFPPQAPAFALILAVFVFVVREMARRDKSLSLLRLSTSLTALLLVAWPLGHLSLLREMRDLDNPALFQIGRDVTFFLVFIIWAQDIAAWAVGLTMGKHRLAVQISPKKSWEGAVGGLLAAVLTAFVLREFWLVAVFTRVEVLLVGAAVGVLGQLSDLSESLLKRSFGVKDSSKLLPGHGGVLDRFDAFLFSAPFLYFYLILTGHGG